MATNEGGQMIIVPTAKHGGFRGGRFNLTFALILICVISNIT